jgi:hypothetical protein
MLSVRLTQISAARANDAAVTPTNFSNFVTQLPPFEAVT